MTHLKRKREQKGLQSSPKVPGTKVQESLLLERRILDTTTHYSKLTVRMLYYIFISQFHYPAGRKFYKAMNYRLGKLRRFSAELNARFVDPTRHFVDVLNPYYLIELWVEKDTIRTLLESLAAKYRLSILVLRGFGSLSCFRKSLARASKRGVRKVLYIGDHDPSGLLIDRVAERETNLEVERIALTIGQIRRLGLPSIPVNLKDSRAESYIKKFGMRCWEVESMRPRTFFRLIEEKLKENVPPEFLVEAQVRDQASRMSKPISELFRRMIEEDSFRMLKMGKSKPEIQAQLATKYASVLKRNENRAGQHEKRC